MFTTDEYAGISHLLNRYGVAVDSKCWGAFDQIFADDVIADYGGPVIFSGLAAFKRGAEAAWGSFDASQHSMSNIVWERHADAGRSLTYGNWFIIRKAAAGGDRWEGRGWYYDEWTLLGAGWRIRRRCCRTMWWSGNPLVPNANFKPGGSDAEAASQTFSLADAAAEDLFDFFRSPT
jgi:SnoaL-like domain